MEFRETIRFAYFSNNWILNFWRKMMGCFNHMWFELWRSDLIFLLTDISLHNICLQYWFYYGNSSTNFSLFSQDVDKSKSRASLSSIRSGADKKRCTMWLMSVSYIIFSKVIYLVGTDNCSGRAKFVDEFFTL